MHKKLFYPNEFYKKIEDVNLNNYKNRFKAIIIDHDNTLIKRGETFLEEGVLNWLNEASKIFKIGIISNNKKNKLSIIEENFKIPFLKNALKPLPFSFKKMIRILKVRNSEVILIGDQIFTDILGGNILNLYTILVEPRDKSKDFFLTKIQRYFESYFLKKLRNWLCYN